MADKKATELTVLSSPELADAAYIGDGLSSDAYVEFSRLLGQIGIVPGGRISGSTTAYDTSDLTAITTIYYVPYKHNLIQLYDTTNSVWITYALSANLSLSVPSDTATNHDIFIHLSGGVPALTSIAWTDSTTRATDVVYQDGRLVASGSADKLLVGTIRTTGVSGQTQDDLVARYISNVYNREWKRLRDNLNTDHRYITATVRPWNNDSTYRVYFVQSIPSLVSMGFRGEGYNSDWNRYHFQGLSLDSTTGTTVIGLRGNLWIGAETGHSFVPVDIGYHYVQTIERGDNYNQFWRNSASFCSLKC